MTLSTTRRASAPQILDRCRELVRPALVESVGRLHPWHAETAAFSLGWSGAGGEPVPGSQGKGVRQALAVHRLVLVDFPAQPVRLHVQQVVLDRGGIGGDARLHRVGDLGVAAETA
ncbi:hypothetical protein ABZ679_20155, partial [Streptomyces fimicarius]